MRIHVIPAGKVAPRRAIVPGKPSEEQWYMLRQLLRKKKGLREDSEIFDYLASNLGTDNLGVLSAEEVDDLIKRLEHAA